MKKSAFLLLAAAAPVALAWSAPVLAQDAGVEAEADSASGEILVMARKRQESILKVPVVATALTSEQLDRQQVTNITGITQQVAGLQVGSNVLSVGTQIALRGVGTSAIDAGIDQSVSLNIDGLQFSQGATYSVGLFDMAQVEVLKGPQALFFGKNSPGGVIAIRTADPGSNFEVIARASYGIEAQEKRGELIISGPLSDTFGIRLAGMYSNDNGYFFNRATALPGTGAQTPRSTRYNAGEEYILRGTLVWKPTSDFSARLKINHNSRDVIGGASSMGGCPDGNAAVIGIPFINPNDDCKVDRTVYLVDIDPAAFPEVRNNGVPFVNRKTSFGTLELNYTVADHLSLSSTTGYHHTRFDGLLNGTNTGYAGTPLIADNRFKRHDFTQEIRLDSDFSGPFNFLVGGYYQNARTTNRVWVGGNIVLFGDPAYATLLSGVNDVHIEAFSGFGQLRWKPVETLEIAAGARYTDERRRDDASSATSFSSPLTPITIANPRLRSKNWSPELTITYTPTDDLTVFGALRQGYKSGSFIMTLPAEPGEDNSFDDERVRGGEIGVKARMLDRALSVESAFYYYNYANLQVGVNAISSGGLPVLRTVNAASSKVYGVDFQATYRPPSIEGLTMRLAVNWNHARFSDFPNSPCWGGQRVADGCDRQPVEVTDAGAITAGQFVIEPGTGRRVQYTAQNLTGLSLPKAADWTATGGFDYEVPVSQFRLNFGVNGQYSSKFLNNLGRRDDFYQPAFFKLNANIGIRAENDSWQLDLIGNNLTSKFVAGACAQFSAQTGQIFLAPETGTNSRNIAGVDELACTPEKGREVFLRLTLRPTAF
jgi:iron complex outermembrane receptor protein